MSPSPLEAFKSLDSVESRPRSKSSEVRQRRRRRPLSDSFTLKLNSNADKIITMFKEMKNATTKAAQRCIESGYELLAHGDLPDWLKDNEFLPKFHRPHIPSIKHCFKSMTKIHSETVNIWTHLLGQIMFILASINFYFACPEYNPTYLPTFFKYFLFWLPSYWTLSVNGTPITRPLVGQGNWNSCQIDVCSYTGMSLLEHVSIGFFFMGASLCLMFSWIFHTFCCYSERAAIILAKLDYIGIIFLIVTSSLPCFSFAFRDNLFFQSFYIIAIIVCGSVCIVAASMDKFSTPEYRTSRAALFSALGLFGVIPLCHYFAISGYDSFVHKFGGNYIVIMGLVYLSGATIYAKRFPEKWFPQIFNIYFQSHQILHICVVAALFSLLKGLFVMVHNK